MDKWITLRTFAQKSANFVVKTAFLSQKHKKEYSLRALSKTQKLTALVLLILMQIILTLLLCSNFFRQTNVPLIATTVVIDAGHGGIDGGVTVDGVKESDLNLAYSQTLAKVFENAGFGVVETRKSQGGLYGFASDGFKRRDMEKRREIIAESNASFVISLHMNKFSDGTRSGPQVFFQRGDSDGQTLAESIQNVLNGFTGNSHSALAGDYYVCRTSSCPSVIVECGFLSNDSERAKLLDDDYKTSLCEKIYQGVMLYLYSAVD